MPESQSVCIQTGKHLCEQEVLTYQQLMVKNRSEEEIVQKGMQFGVRMEFGCNNHEKRPQKPQNHLAFNSGIE